MLPSYLLGPSPERNALPSLSSVQEAQRVPSRESAGMQEMCAGMITVRNPRCRAVTKGMKQRRSLVLENDVSRWSKQLRLIGESADKSRLVSTRSKHPKDLQGMDDTRDVTQYCQEDVDQKVGIATALKEDTKGRKEDGEDDFANITMFKAMLVIILVTPQPSTRFRVMGRKAK